MPMIEELSDEFGRVEGNKLMHGASGQALRGEDHSHPQSAASSGAVGAGAAQSGESGCAMPSGGPS